MKHTLLAIALLMIVSLVACSMQVSTLNQTTAGNPATDSSVASTLPIATSIPGTANDAAEEAEIRELVENFGRRLQMVSLLAPDAAQELQKQYSEFVSPALLEMWLNDISKAPGRRVSSPWPDRIEITALSREGPEKYEMTGILVEVTSTESGTDEAAAKIPIHIVVRREQGGWLITEYAEER
jgi:hypothetical protein